MHIASQKNMLPMINYLKFAMPLLQAFCVKKQMASHDGLSKEYEK